MANPGRGGETERRLLAPNRLVKPQLCCAAQMAVDEGAVEQIALPEAMLGGCASRALKVMAGYWKTGDPP